jgi:hypothetical protein
MALGTSRRDLSLIGEDIVELLNDIIIILQVHRSAFHSG